jgi:glycosyltransferase involved in cell wall biosynthesis
MLFVGSRTREYYRWVTRVRDPRRYAWLPYPHDPEPFERASTGRRTRGSSFNVLYVGRLVETKAVDRLLEAVRSIWVAGLKEVKLLVAGDGPERANLMSRAKKEGLGTIVHFVGTVPSDDVPEIMRESDAVVLPSHREPWGVVINEALSAGKPVVAPRWVGAAGDILVDGQTGLITAGNSAQELADALTKLARNRDWGEELGRRGAQLVRSGGWNVSRAVANFRALFDDAVNSGVTVGF